MEPEKRLSRLPSYILDLPLRMDLDSSSSWNECIISCPFDMKTLESVEPLRSIIYAVRLARVMEAPLSGGSFWLEPNEALTSAFAGLSKLFLFLAASTNEAVLCSY